LAKFVRVGLKPLHPYSTRHRAEGTRPQKSEIEKCALFDHKTEARQTITRGRLAHFFFPQPQPPFGFVGSTGALNPCCAAEAGPEVEGGAAFIAAGGGGGRVLANRVFESGRPEPEEFEAKVAVG
jgi:hypothetical protein